MSARHPGDPGHRRGQAGAHLRALVAALLLVAPLAGLAAPAVAQDVIGGAALGTEGLAFDASTGVPAPTVPATTWLIADLRSGEVLAARGAHVARPPASTLKTLTAVALMPRLSPDSVRVAIDGDVRVDGGTTGMVVGGEYSVRDMWHGLLLDSGNDTALGLAHAFDEDTGVTLDLMAAEAKRLQALDTVVRTPHGLDARGQVSSVYDMALFARAALTIPYFRQVTTARTYQFPAPGGSFQIQNENRLLGRYEGVLGGKTGYTRQAGMTYWVAAERGDTALLVVLFDIRGRMDTAARSLLDWGFAHRDDLAPVGVLVEPEVPTVTKAPALAQEADEPLPEPQEVDWRILAIGGVTLIGAAVAVGLTRAGTRAPGSTRRSADRGRTTSAR